MIIIEFIIECIFETIFGWIGHTLVKIITFGKADLDWRSGSGAVLAPLIGLICVISISILTTLLIQRQFIS